MSGSLAGSRSRFATRNSGSSSSKTSTGRRSARSKLHFQRYLASSHARAAAALARASGEAGGAISLDASKAPALELYLPVPAHRAAWTGDERILVATQDDEREAPIAFSPAGERRVLSRTTPPDIPVLALVPVETDFDRVGSGENLIGGGGGGAPAGPPGGLYLTNSHLIETFESWTKGSPEIEVHMLGQAGASDSLTTYSLRRRTVGRLLLLRPERAGLERQRRC